MQQKAVGQIRCFRNRDLLFRTLFFFTFKPKSFSSFNALFSDLLGFYCATLFREDLKFRVQTLDSELLNPNFRVRTFESELSSPNFGLRTSKSERWWTPSRTVADYAEQTFGEIVLSDSSPFSLEPNLLESFGIFSDTGSTIIALKCSPGRANSPKLCALFRFQKIDLRFT